MIISKSFGSRAFDAALIVILTVISAVTLFPILHTVAVSFSNPAIAGSGTITVLPKGLSLSAYTRVLDDKQFFSSLWVSVERIVITLALGTGVTYLAAFPFSRETRDFRMRNVYLWLLLIVSSFNGGIIPGYMNAKNLGLYDNFWILVLPYLFNFGNILLVFNFWRNLPKELDDCSNIDGAGPWTKLTHIYFPLSLPVLATISLFTIVNTWNEYFQAIVFINNPHLMPLQTYLQQIVVTIDPTRPEDISKAGGSLSEISNQTLDAAKISLTMLPILFVYPFLQRYFIHGITLGSVKE
ncbi:carbohydrate ABC transporter permease [Paenibacillus sp. MWE-103]|uniref:Carbohydrate ABC transporter permease n=1 Tax=Paenibacillus artemisiicola TaxID=1172618 RepID=A0ABS3W470_9BACL|nr:carbohydrate ABC transporter permease [Paenibacillus artemisiicola]MBO7743101.1 carbohydrate ABC transporter permease [Paenibacillus artemisiicola]